MKKFSVFSKIVRCFHAESFKMSFIKHSMRLDDKLRINIEKKRNINTTTMFPYLC